MQYLSYQNVIRHEINYLRVRKVSLGNDSSSSLSDDDFVSDNDDYDDAILVGAYFSYFY